MMIVRILYLFFKEAENVSNYTYNSKLCTAAQVNYDFIVTCNCLMFLAFSTTGAAKFAAFRTC